VQPGFGAGTPTAGSVIFTATFVTNANSSGQFSLGGKTTLTLGEVPVSAGSIAVLSASRSSGSLLPGIFTGYTSTGQRVNISPVTYVIKSQYLGSADFTASAYSLGVAETVTRDTTQTVIVVTPNPAQFAQVVTITATVRNVGGLIAPWAA